VSFHFVLNINVSEPFIAVPFILLNIGNCNICWVFNPAYRADGSWISAFAGMTGQWKGTAGSKEVRVISIFLVMPH
jgi:hypothetical protein